MNKLLPSFALILALTCLALSAAHAQESIPAALSQSQEKHTVPDPDTANANDAPWVILGGISRHTCRDCGFRESNPGFALQWKSEWLNRYMDSNDWRLTAGAYINSNNRNSVYVGAMWLPIEYGVVKAGVQAAVISNYLKQSITPTLLPTISVETAHVGADIFLVPKFPSVSSAVLLSFKVRY